MSNHDDVFRPSFIKMKAILVGESGAGKTNIIERLVNGRFDPSRVGTTQYDIAKTWFEIGQKHLIAEVDIWDTVGQETHHSLPPNLYKDCQICIIVYDVTKRNSLESAKWWYDQCIRHQPPCLTDFSVPNVVLVGNKIDLDHLREITTEEGKMAAHVLGINFFVEQTSTTRNELSAFDCYLAGLVKAVVVRAATLAEKPAAPAPTAESTIASAPAFKIGASNERYYHMDSDKKRIYKEKQPDDTCPCS